MVYTAMMSRSNIVYSTETIYFFIFISNGVLKNTVLFRNRFVVKYVFYGVFLYLA